VKKIKVAEATGPVLDYLVSKAANPPGQCAWHGWWQDEEGFLFDPLNECRYSPSTDWAQGGPIIERERIDLQAKINSGSDYDEWLAVKGVGSKQRRRYGPTPLIAAMRCYVVSKLGDEVEVPDELLR
jgi:hypothetical protein